MSNGKLVVLTSETESDRPAKKSLGALGQKSVADMSTTIILQTLLLAHAAVDTFPA